MEIIFEVILQILFEIFGQLFIGFSFVSLGTLFERLIRWKKLKSPLVAWVGCLILGGLGGWASLHFFPHHFIKNIYLKILNLIITPFLIGISMGYSGTYAIEKGKAPIGLDNFRYAYLFALAFAMVRFGFGK